MVAPYDLLQSVLKTCPDKFKFKISRLERNNWRVLNLFGEVRDAEDLPEQVCDLMPEFNNPEETVRFFYALTNYPPTEVLSKYKELEEVKKEAVQKLKYEDAERDIENNVVLAAGIYLLYKYGKLEDLKPTDTILGAYTEIGNLLPSEISGEYAKYVLGAAGGSTKREVERVVREKRESVREGGEEEREADPIYILVKRAVSYCKSMIIPKPNFPFPNERSVINNAYMSLSSRLGRENISVPDIDLIDVSQLDCGECYGYAVEYYKDKYGDDMRYWTQVGGGAIARCIADGLYELIKKVVGRREISKEEVRSMEERYASETKREEEELGEVERFLSELYSTMTGGEKSLGISSDKVPDFLMTYLSLLNQAGLEPKDYEELSKMFVTFLQLLKDANLSPSQYKELLDRVLVLPSDVKKNIAASMITVLREYSSGKINAKTALDEIGTILKLVRVEETEVPVEKHEEKTEIPVEVEKPKKKETVSVKKHEKEITPKEERPVEPTIITEVRKYPNIYTVASSHKEFVDKIKQYGIKRALVFSYNNAVFVIPNMDYTISKNAKVIVYYAPEKANELRDATGSWARQIYGYGAAGLFYYGKVIGAEVDINLDNQRMYFLRPIVNVEIFNAKDLVQYITSLPGVNLCVVSFYTARIFGVIKSCYISEKPGSILDLSTLNPVQKKV